MLRGMGLMHLAKNEKAKKELAEKGMALGIGLIYRQRDVLSLYWADCPISATAFHTCNTVMALTGRLNSLHVKIIWPPLSVGCTLGLAQ